MRVFQNQAGFRSQQGVVLIVALIILVVISMLATFSVRNSSLTEIASGSVRTTNLATQAAEIALRHCEGLITTAYLSTPINEIATYQSPPKWQTISNWDGVASTVIVVPDSVVNQSGLASTFRRPPECMYEKLTSTTTTSFFITARGFGPEVIAVASGSSRRPSGTEVWVQSTIEVSATGSGGSGGGGGGSGGSSDAGGDYNND